MLLKPLTYLLSVFVFTLTAQVSAADQSMEEVVVAVIKAAKAGSEQDMQKHIDTVQLKKGRHGILLSDLRALLANIDESKLKLESRVAGPFLVRITAPIRYDFELVYRIPDFGSEPPRYVIVAAHP